MRHTHRKHLMTIEEIQTMNRIITRPDFDGVVCAVLLRAAIGRQLPVLWVQPNDIQHGRVDVGPNDIIANLPVDRNCAMWFDHHISNEIPSDFKGLYRVAPSAAGLVYEYYNKELKDRYQTLVEQTDKIDAAQLNLDEILHPEKFPYILLSMTICAATESDLGYCDDLVALLSSQTIDAIMAEPQVQQRCDRVLAENKIYEQCLKTHTRVQGQVSITDFRGIEPIPNGNRFLVYSLFPESVVNMKIFHESSKTVVKLGHSILNRNCNVNIGKLLARYDGGGHRGAGACRLDQSGSDDQIKEILAILIENKE
jgi:hypothetical protein